MTGLELAWMAGWLEGEGSFYCHIEKPRQPTHNAYRRLTVRAASVDEETVRRAQAIAGGRVFGPYHYDEKRQPYFQWAISGRTAAADFMRLIRPYMGTRRRTQIDAALAKGTST